MYSLHKTAKTYGQLPSNVLKISWPILAYSFDQAVGFYGAWVDARLAEREEYKEGGTTKYRNKYTVDQILGVDSSIEPTSEGLLAALG